MKCLALWLIALMVLLVQAVPMDKRDGAVPYQITSPAVNSTWYINQNLVIVWNKPSDNTPINVGLVAGDNEVLSANSILVADGLSGSIGALLYPVSKSLGNSTNPWRVAIAHGSDPVVYSGSFYISSDTTHEPINTTPSASGASYSALASISILGPNGQPLTFAENGASSAIAKVASPCLGAIVMMTMAIILS
ncbi:hypothetical protein DM01DRAFT_1332077 [Hesseltinella vesiculosa]|uniref:Uncharacterized protein n=1 Tax=Hesseltinella vesiculosa TaxID=101127 RepID=A0A1X2GU01_9FUNG|nr:hypothetical protein DM01DRAFT_1332077 [Hesseltinella vesiculosa]